MPNAMMNGDDVRGLLLVSDTTYCFIVLCGGKEFGSHYNFSVLFDLDSMMECKVI